MYSTRVIIYYLRLMHVLTYCISLQSVSRYMFISLAGALEKFPEFPSSEVSSIIMAS